MIRFEKLNKRFRRTSVLRDVNLEIARGDRVALVGSNGAGKTTLIRCLLGEYLCDGKVEVNGLDPRQHRSEVLPRIGFVPQLPPPLKMPVGQLLNFSASVCGADVQRMHGVAKRLGLDPAELKHRPFVKLSGGQKQKLLISIALGRDTDLLIMDEPAANLDPEARHIFFGLLAERQDDSVMLISSHRLDEVAALVNRVVEMDQGRVVLDDSVADLVAMNSQLRCTLRLVRPEEAFHKAITQWGFMSRDEGITWEGVVAAPDRLRFLGVLSRYAGLLAGVQLEEERDNAA
jgi:ABC-2 type transport system ATP-binding protein